MDPLKNIKPQLCYLSLGRSIYPAQTWVSCQASVLYIKIFDMRWRRGANNSLASSPAPGSDAFPTPLFFGAHFADVICRGAQSFTPLIPLYTMVKVIEIRLEMKSNFYNFSHGHGHL